MLKVTVQNTGLFVLLWLLLGDFVLGWFHYNVNSPQNRQSGKSAPDNEEQSCFCHVSYVLCLTQDTCLCATDKQNLQEVLISEGSKQDARLASRRVFSHFPPSLSFDVIFIIWFSVL